jgi:hypothetical protein
MQVAIDRAMSCKFCAVGDQTATNHASTADCVAALTAEIAALRNEPRKPRQPRSFILDGPPRRDEQPPEHAVAPKLSLQR